MPNECIFFHLIGFAIRPCLGQPLYYLKNLNNNRLHLFAEANIEILGEINFLLNSNLEKNKKNIFAQTFQSFNLFQVLRLASDLQVC